MMRTGFALTALAASMGIFATACGPSTYEDCLLENIGRASTRVGEVAVMRACAAKFPQPAEEPATPKRELSPVALTASELREIRCTARGRYGEHVIDFASDADNGWVLKTVEVELSAEGAARTRFELSIRSTLPAQRVVKTSPSFHAGSCTVTEAVGKRR
jgi:hypothetical protein